MRSLLRPYIILLFLSISSLWSQVSPPPSLQAQLDAGQGDSVITLIPGIYESSVTDRAEHLLLNRVSDVRIYAEGVHLICKTPRRALTIRRSQNVHLSGLTIDYDPLTFSQGRVVSVEPSSLVMEVDAGYPEPNWPTADRVVIHDSVSGLNKVGASTLNLSGIDSLPDGNFRLTNLSDFGGVFAGDAVSVWRSSDTGYTVLLDQCEASTLENITIQATPTGWTILETDSSEMTYDGVRIEPGPTPVGATQARLRASYSDGLHSRGARVGPTIVDCHFRALGDDGIAIRGHWGVVVEAQTATNELVVAFPNSDLLLGSLRLVSTAAQTIQEGATITAVEALDPVSIDIESIIEAQYPDYAFASLYRRLYRLTLDGPITASVGDLTGHPAQNGHGFEITRSSVTDTRARGIIVKSSDGLIDGNRIEHTALPGILCVAEFKYFLEADFSQNLLISDNHLIDNCIGRLYRLAPKEYGAIVLTSDPGWGAALGHRNIRILDNTIVNCPVMNIQLHAASDVIIEGNQFLKTHARALPPIVNHDPANGYLILSDAVENVRVQNNRWLFAGSFAAAAALDAPVFIIA